MCEKYLLSYHKSDIVTILEYFDVDKCFSVNINFLELFESDTNLGNALLTDPESSLKNWNSALLDVQNSLINELDQKVKLKSKVTCRIHSLPPWPHISRAVFPGNNDANKFLQISGTVVRISERKLLEYQRQYMCWKCKYPITVEARYDKKNIIKIPKRCANPEGCTCKKLITFGELDAVNCKDYQEIKIQEDVSKLNVGSVPSSITVTLEDDLVNICKPGENITITGVVKRRWSDFEKGVKVVVDIVVQANHVLVNNSTSSIIVADDIQASFNNFWEKFKMNPLEGRNVILNSISPEIYGLYLVKLAVAIVLAGGNQTEENIQSTGINTRSESHLLLVGDPGTGKSQLLKFASKIISRSVLTTGIGSTAAGLTVSAIMESGEWHLEAGALVMADGGICCIDEFNSMREHDRTSIHEAMEQQSISVAKAGMVCKLKTRCSILAACNPKSSIDINQPLCMNVAMSGPLLSRFDLVLLLRDIVQEENDYAFAYFVLNQTVDSTGESAPWCLEKLQAYYALIRKAKPKLTTEAETILSTYYQLQRKFGNRNKARTTVRLLESLIRLSQGHAKLMFHSEVQIMDTIFPIILIDNALDYDSSLLNLKLDINTFSENPEAVYLNYLSVILTKLNLEHILTNEPDLTKTRFFQENTNEDIEKNRESFSQRSTRFEVQGKDEIINDNGSPLNKADFSYDIKNKNFEELEVQGKNKVINIENKEINTNKAGSLHDKENTNVEEFEAQENDEVININDKGSNSNNRNLQKDLTRQNQEANKINEKKRATNIQLYSKSIANAKRINPLGSVETHKKSTKTTFSCQKWPSAQEIDELFEDHPAELISPCEPNLDKYKKTMKRKSFNHFEVPSTSSEKPKIFDKSKQFREDGNESHCSISNHKRKQDILSGGKVVKKTMQSKVKCKEIMEAINNLPSINDDFSTLNSDFYHEDNDKFESTSKQVQHVDEIEPDSKVTKITSNSSEIPSSNLNFKTCVNALSKFQFIPRENREKDKTKAINIDISNTGDSEIRKKSIEKSSFEIKPAVTNVEKPKKTGKVPLKTLSSVMDFDKLDNDIKTFNIDDIFKNCKKSKPKINVNCPPINQIKGVASNNEGDYNKEKLILDIEQKENQPGQSKDRKTGLFRSNFPSLNLDLDDFDLSQL